MEKKNNFGTQRGLASSQAMQHGMEVGKENDRRIRKLVKKLGKYMKLHLDYKDARVVNEAISAVYDLTQEERIELLHALDFTRNGGKMKPQVNGNNNTQNFYL